MKRATLLKATLGLALLSAQLAHAAGVRNPLHPAHFWDKVLAPRFVSSEAQAGPVAVTNPLHPAYYMSKNGIDTVFVSTAATTWLPVTNPLHPRFRHH